MRILLILLLMTQTCFGAVVSYRYTDKATGEERGVCYSDENGNQPINNPDWNVETISEKDRAFYISKQKKQLDDKLKAQKDIKKDIKTKLKALGLSQEEVDVLLGKDE